MTKTAKALEKAAQELSNQVGLLNFGPPVTHVYNPLVYAWKTHQAYLRRFGQNKKRLVFFGMNPGPFGMGQTGIPFGEIASVRDWMGLSGQIRKPPVEHPKRPVQGFDCTRSEVSGSRLWGAIQEHFGSPEAFFEIAFVANYCPLFFLEESGRNRTPDKLPKAERDPLLELCDEHLRRLVEILQPKWVVGVGRFATTRAKKALAKTVKIGMISHPSPASPKANKGWQPLVRKELMEQKIPLCE